MAVRKVLLGFYALALLVFGGALAIVVLFDRPAGAQLDGAPSPPSQPTTTEAPAPPPRRANDDDKPEPETAPRNIRAEVEQKVEADRPRLNSAHDVDSYLVDLEARARRNGRVTALEIEPGVMAIREHEAQLGPDQALQKTAEFTQKMARLSAELDKRPLNQEPPFPAPPLPR
jgi:hypothetical protein